MSPRSTMVASAPSSGPAPTLEQLLAMTDRQLSDELDTARAAKDAEYWRFSRGARVRPGGPGTDRYGRAMRERSRRIRARRITLPSTMCLLGVQLARESARILGAKRAPRRSQIDAYVLDVLAVAS